jgi:hypothetical protein
MERREVYATTGPRMRVRFFGGWDFDPDDALRRDLAQIGYTKGVPMGARPAGWHPPQGQGAELPGLCPARSDRRQPRPHPDHQGLARRRRQDAGAGLRRRLVRTIAAIGEDGKLPPVGDTVDLSIPSWTNTIGASELGTVWTDPDFDPEAARLLLRPRHRDPDPALDRL